MSQATNTQLRTALITGAGQNMGLGVAQHLAREGIRVIINDIDEARAETAVAGIRDAGGEAAAVDYLISDGGSWVTGQTIPVNGGSYAI